jgi:hypothetical protein
MPIDYVVAMDGALVVEVWHGDITVDELYGHRKEQAADRAIVNGARVLADIRRASFEGITENQMAAFAESYRATEAAPRARTLAFVATDGFSKARAYEKASRTFLRNVVVFTSLSTACKWLGIDVAIVADAIEAFRSRNGNRMAGQS